jgi:AraC-like DNA-binding protein/mannose-6-phosphate isomerase-like protein (cupin superfamily)
MQAIGMRDRSRKELALDQARIVKVGSGFGTRVELLRTTYQSQTFARHSHDTYTLGLVLAGAGTFWYRGEEHLARKGDVVVIEPGEVHTGSVGFGVDSLSYLAVYLPVELAILHAESAGARGGKPPEFSSCVLRDPTVRRAYQALDQAIGSPDAFHHRNSPGNANAAADLDEGAAQEAVCVAITDLIRRHAVRHGERYKADARLGKVREPRIVSVVREVLEDSFAEAGETSLQVLAQRTGVTPFQVIRAFRGATGLAPHQFLIQVRVERARQLLADGAAPSLAALMTGFTDQSHLTYHFKKHLGITPGNYRRCVSIR